jgi:hypothetical protein
MNRILDMDTYTPFLRYKPTHHGTVRPPLYARHSAAISVVGIHRSEVGYFLQLIFRILFTACFLENLSSHDKNVSGSWWLEPVYPRAGRRQSYGPEVLTNSIHTISYLEIIRIDIVLYNTSRGLVPSLDVAGPNTGEDRGIDIVQMCQISWLFSALLSPGPSLCLNANDNLCRFITQTWLICRPLHSSSRGV